MAHVPLGDAGSEVTPYPYILILGQDDNERIMGARLGDWGVSVQWNTELVGLDPEGEGIGATLKMADGTTRRISAAWVGGCDGAHSAVRELNGIGFPGAPYEHVFYVADVTMTGTMVPDEVNVYLWREGFHLLFPMRGQDHWRVVGIVPEEMRGRDDLTFDDVVPSIHRQAQSGLSFSGCSWFSTYRIHHRAAARFRKDRCFLLGDAAHIHSPVGAQGMNTGLQDAYNLAWKLALVVKRQAAASLLDSYEAERVPVARRLLDTTDRLFRIVVSDSWIAGVMRTKILARIAAFVMSRPAIRRFAFRVVSQTGIHYRNGPLSVSLGELPKDAPQAGDRFPWLHLKLHAGGATEDLFAKLDDTHFHLIVIGQEGRVDLPGFGDLFRVHVIPADPVNDAALNRVGIASPSFYLIRPDGHVGLCGAEIDAGAMQRYLRETLGLAGR
jgi:2-polyprenyl-6-methoxyphenol hydroxylase-like FAD-dependent oxidoreductase